MVIGHQKGRDTRENIRRNFGDGPTGGLPQGRAADAPRREVRHPGRHLHRHPRRRPDASAPRSAARRTAIAESLLTMAGLRDADRRRRDRRGRQRRRARDRRRRPGADAGERDLLGGLAGGLRLDPLEGREQGAGSRRDDADHRARSLGFGIIDEVIPRSIRRTSTRATPSWPSAKRSAATWTNCSALVQHDDGSTRSSSPLRQIPPHRRLDGVGGGLREDGKARNRTPKTQKTWTRNPYCA